MGWASGSELAESVWSIVRPHIAKSKRKAVALEFIEAFEDHDCDTLYECDELMADAGIEVE